MKEVTTDDRIKLEALRNARVQTVRKFLELENDLFRSHDAAQKQVLTTQMEKLVERCINIEDGIQSLSYIYAADQDRMVKGAIQEFHDKWGDVEKLLREEKELRAEKLKPFDDALNEVEERGKRRESAFKKWMEEFERERKEREAYWERRHENIKAIRERKKKERDERLEQQRREREEKVKQSKVEEHEQWQDEELNGEKVKQSKFEKHQQMDKEKNKAEGVCLSEERETLRSADSVLEEVKQMEKHSSDVIRKGRENIRDIQGRCREREKEDKANWACEYLREQEREIEDCMQRPEFEGPISQRLSPNPNREWPARDGREENQQSPPTLCDPHSMFLAQPEDHQVSRPATTLLDGDVASSVDDNPEAVADHNQFLDEHVLLNPGLPGEQSSVNGVRVALPPSAGSRQWRESEPRSRFHQSSGLNELINIKDGGSGVHRPTLGLPNVRWAYWLPRILGCFTPSANIEAAGQDTYTQSPESSPHQAVGPSSPSESLALVAYNRGLNKRLTECEAREESTQGSGLTNTTGTGTPRNSDISSLFGISLALLTALPVAAGAVLWKIFTRRKDKVRRGHARQWQLEN